MGITTKTMPADLEKAEQEKIIPNSEPNKDKLTVCNNNISDTEDEHELTTIIKLPLRERLRHFTFAWYTVPISTGGLSLVTSLLPHRFPQLTYIGLVFFILSFILFIIISILLTIRTIISSSVHPLLPSPPSSSSSSHLPSSSSSSSSLTSLDPKITESFFLTTPLLAIATTLSNLQQYAVPHCDVWLVDLLRGCFWGYLALAFVACVWQYDGMFRSYRRDAKSGGRVGISPVVLLPAFPVMLGGTVAGFVAVSQTRANAMAMLMAGAAAQGLGLLVSFCWYGVFFARLVEMGVPDARAGMFVLVGPPSFTAAAFVVMGNLVKGLYVGSEREMVGDVFGLVCLALAVFLWGLAFWFLGMAMAGLWGMPDRKFHLSWWSLIFPNVGFAIATLRIGDAVGSEALAWFGICLAIILIVVWVVVMTFCIRAVVRRDIVWPAKDEDVVFS